MDLNDRPEHQAFREEVRTFLRDNGADAPDDRSSSYRLNPRVYSPEVKAWQKLLVKKGYAARTLPNAYGGFGAEPDILKSRIIADEFFQANIPQGLKAQGISMLVPTLLEHGSEAQKQQWIRPTINADIFWCQGYSEPNAGSDLASLKTKADEDGDDFIINGQKIWTSSANIADMIFCLVRTEPDAPKHRGISYIIFPMDLPGIEVRPLQTMTGRPTFNEVFFTDVRVPKENVVGGRGNGWKVANSTLGHERSMLSNANDSIDRLNRIRKILFAETVDGRRLIENPVFSDRFVRLQSRVEGMRLHEMHLISLEAKDQSLGLAGLVPKLLGCELNHQLDALAIDALGEMGVFHDGNTSMEQIGIWQQLYMYDLGLIIGGGTAQIQKNIISERGLGMPREPKPAPVQ